MVNENKNLEQIPLNENPEKEAFIDDKEKIKKPEQQENVSESKQEQGEKINEVAQDDKLQDDLQNKDENNSQQERMRKIDEILSEDMSDIFLSLPKDKQREFKEEGEKTVLKINQLMEKAKIKVSKIVNLIKNWLGIIPNANKYYLEQEAKIKTDKILKLRNKD